MRLLKLMVSCAAVLVATSGQLEAALITVSETIDVTGYVAGTSIIKSFPAPVSVSAGDSVDYTLHFSNNKALQVMDGNELLYAWFDEASQSSSFTINNIELHFLDFQGTPGTSQTLTKSTESTGVAHLGPSFSGYLSAGQSMQYSGFRVTYDVASLSVDPSTFGSVWFKQGGNVNVVEAVPEPSSIGIWCIGAFGTAVIARRRQLKQKQSTSA